MVETLIANARYDFQEQGRETAAKGSIRGLEDETIVLSVSLMIESAHELESTCSIDSMAGVAPNQSKRMKTKSRASGTDSLDDNLTVLKPIKSS